MHKYRSYRTDACRFTQGDTMSILPRRVSARPGVPPVLWGLLALLGGLAYLILH